MRYAQAGLKSQPRCKKLILTAKLALVIQIGIVCVNGRFIKMGCQGKHKGKEYTGNDIPHGVLPKGMYRLPEKDFGLGAVMLLAACDDGVFRKILIELT